MDTAPSISPFTLASVSAIRQLYPESLADKSFDNTGLLLESILNLNRPTRLRNGVLLTIDLTQAVATEAIEKNVSLVVAYHPFIFRGITSITTKDSQQKSLLRLAAEGISVYSPHTAVDAIVGGNADWLADIVIDRYQPPDSQPPESQEEPSKPSQDSQTLTGHGCRYQLTHFPSTRRKERGYMEYKHHERMPIVPVPNPPPGHEEAGYGRCLKLAEPISLEVILHRLLRCMGDPKAVKLGLPHHRAAVNFGDVQISVIAVCAGSGAGVFSNLKEPAELLLTGEMSHHEARMAVEQGQYVICLDHSNSERGYLHDVMKPILSDKIAEEWAKLRNAQAGITSKGMMSEILRDESCAVEVSEVDRDPFCTLVKDA